MAGSVGMIAYFIIAKYALKWPTHGEELKDPAHAVQGTSYEPVND